VANQANQQQTNQGTAPQVGGGREAMNTYAFGPLSLTVRGLGLYLGGEHLDRWIASASVDDLRAANKAAWKVRRPLERQGARENNVSVYGWNDRRDAAIFVCEAVCKATWRALRAAGETP
jgi:hypothetical protein